MRPTARRGLLSVRNIRPSASESRYACCLVAPGPNLPDRIIHQSRVLRKVHTRVARSLISSSHILFHSSLKQGSSPCLRGRQGYPQMKVCTYQQPSSVSWYCIELSTLSHPESAPLLQDSSGSGGPQSAPTQSVTDRLGSILQDPLTPLNKILLILLLVFLLLCSTFLGLFIGSQHKLRNMPDTPGGEKPPITFTSVVTAPITFTSVITSPSTTTAVFTTTVALPVPSTPPERVSPCCPHLPHILF